MNIAIANKVAATAANKLPSLLIIKFFSIGFLQKDFEQYRGTTIYSTKHTFFSLNCSNLSLFEFQLARSNIILKAHGCLFNSSENFSNLQNLLKIQPVALTKKNKIN